MQNCNNNNQRPCKGLCSLFLYAPFTCYLHALMSLDVDWEISDEQQIERRKKLL